MFASHQDSGRSKVKSFKDAKNYLHDYVLILLESPITVPELPIGTSAALHGDRKSWTDGVFETWIFHKKDDSIEVSILLGGSYKEKYLVCNFPPRTALSCDIILQAIGLEYVRVYGRL